MQYLQVSPKGIASLLSSNRKRLFALDVELLVEEEEEEEEEGEGDEEEVDEDEDEEDNEEGDEGEHDPKE